MPLNGAGRGRHSAARRSTNRVRRRFLGSVLLALGLAALGCHGRGALQGQDGAPVGAGGSSSNDAASASGGASGSGSPSDGDPTADAGAETGGPLDSGLDPGLDPGFVGMRRLSDVEYARTVQDLLGLSGLDASLAASFASLPPEGSGFHQYDNLAGRDPIFAARYQTYFTNAVTLVEQAFASDALRARILTCVPASATDDACARDIVRAFGLRAWRRPLSAAELTDLAALVRTDLTAGNDFPSAIQVALVALLSSESFLYRLELDPLAAGTRAHLLTSYELASRLSYLVWSTMPDETLLALAASDELQKPDVLAAQATRLLADARADSLVRNFFGQWLQFRALSTTLLQRATPGWSLPWQSSLGEEARLFVDEIVRGNGTFADLFTTDVNFVDGNLASIYMVPPPAVPRAFARTVLPGDARKGYLGLAAFLTVTSHAGETSPSLRGDWIDEELLCLAIPEGPTGAVPGPPTPGLTPRQYMEQRLAEPGCAACHKMFEPVGIGLETFDEVGTFRLAYPADPGTFIDPTGAMPDGTPYDGLKGLADLLGKDSRVQACGRREVLTYALGRPLADADASRLAAIDARWNAAGGTVRELLGALVVDELFRTRRAEGTP
jgi:hypothetical protein